MNKFGLISVPFSERDLSRNFLFPFIFLSFWALLLLSLLTQHPHLYIMDLFDDEFDDWDSR